MTDDNFQDIMAAIETVICQYEEIRDGLRRLERKLDFIELEEEIEMGMLDDVVKAVDAAVADMSDAVAELVALKANQANPADAVKASELAARINAAATTLKTAVDTAKAA